MKISLLRLFGIILQNTTIKSGIWYLISDFLLKGMAFVTIPIFTRLLSVEDYGIVSVYTSFVGVMSIISGLDLHAGLGRAAIDFEQDYPKYLSSVLSLSVAFFLGGLLVISALSNTLSSLVELTPDLLLLATIAGYGSFVFGLYNSHLLFQQKYKQKSLLHVVKAISEVVLAIIMILAISKAKYYGRVYSSLIISIVFMVIGFIIIFRKSKKVFFPKAWWYAIKIGIPLVPHSLSGIILAQFDRMAIQALLGATETGLYSFAYNIGMIPLVIQGAIVSAWSPWLYKNLNQNKRDRIREASLILTQLFLIVVAFVVMIGPELAVLLAPNVYSAGISMISVVSLGYFFQFMYMIYVGFAMYHKKTFLVSLGTLLAGGINVVLNLWFIPIFGYEIAAWTTVFSYVALFFFHWANTRFVIRENVVPISKMLLMGTLCTGSVIAIYLVQLSFMPRSSIEAITRYCLGASLILSIAFYSFRQIKRIGIGDKN